MNIIDSTFEAFRQANREHLHYIWRRAQNGQLDGLSEEEKRLAEIMLAHSDEYFNQFEFADVRDIFALSKCGTMQIIPHPNLPPQGGKGLRWKEIHVRVDSARRNTRTCPSDSS